MCSPIFITAATFHRANEKIDVPNISATKAPAQGSASCSQSYSGTPKKRLVSAPRPTRWHCAWLLAALSKSVVWAQQLQPQLGGFDFQHKSLSLEPHAAVLPVQQFSGSLSHSKLVLFQMTTSIFLFFSRSSKVIFFQFLDLAQNIPEVSRNI